MNVSETIGWNLKQNLNARSVTFLHKNGLQEAVTSIHFCENYDKLFCKLAGFEPTSTAPS